MNAALDPGEMKSDLEICLTVGKRLNPKDWPWDNVEQFFDDQLHTQYDWGFKELKEMVVFQQAF